MPTPAKNARYKLGRTGIDLRDTRRLTPSLNPHYLAPHEADVISTQSRR